MATAVTMPQLGESVTEGIVGRWLKAEGDHVERDEPLLEITTDKVNAELPSPIAGILVEIVALEGTTVPVGGELARIDVTVPATAGATVAAPVTVPGLDGAAPRPPGPVDTGKSTASEGGERRRYSPLVRRLALEHRIDLSQIDGTGLAGRVTRDDVLAFIAARSGHPKEEEPSAPLTSPPASAAGSQPAGVSAAPPTEQRIPAPGRTEVSPGLFGVEEILPLTPMRRTIAEHMVRSKHTAPHATTVVEVDMTRLVRWREANKDAVRARHGVDISYLAFVTFATVAALKAFPIMNSSWSDDGIVIKKRVNIGIAVALDDGLVVPVIHDADDKSIVGLARAIEDLAQRARGAGLTHADVQGGTFTVNNVGVFGAVMSTPIINQPQAGILAMNAIVKRPVVIEDDAIAVRSMVNLSLSFDHRIVDGLASGRFMRKVVQNLDAIDIAIL